MLIDIALLADSTIHNIGRTVSLELDRQFNIGLNTCRFPPHITLKQAFSYHGDIEPLTRLFDTFCCLATPPVIRYSGIELTPCVNEETSIWLSIAADHHLTGMQKMLLHLLNEQLGIQPGPLDGKKWRFHTTLAQSRLNPDQHTAIRELAARHTNQLNAPCTHAILLITPPHKPESIDESVSYRIRPLTGPV